MVGADGWIHDVAIAVWCAGANLFGIGLGVAQCHAEPEGRMQLEIEGAPTSLCWQGGWILGKRKLPGHLIARSRLVGIKEERGFVMPDVLILPKDFL